MSNQINEISSFHFRSTRLIDANDDLNSFLKLISIQAKYVVVVLGSFAI